MKKARRPRKPKPVDCPICGEKDIQIPPVCPRCRLRPDYRRLLSIALTVWNDHLIADSLQSGPLPGARRLL